MTVVVALLALTACKSGSSIDCAAAPRVSDSFMSDLVADRVRGAISKMEPEIVQTLGQDQAEAATVPVKTTEPSSALTPTLEFASAGSALK
jgi:hypothetical protein